MSWLNELYFTYENQYGVDNDCKTPLSPVAHMLAHAQIEITLDEMGSFAAARVLSKEEDITVIPVTESSAGRSSGIAPHPLCDNLPYLAGDFSQYCATEKEQKKAEEKFESYIKNLKQWLQSEHTHPKVQVIYRYLEKEDVISDLVKAGIVELEQGVFAKKKVGGQPYEKAIVRFRILSDDIEDVPACWEDESLFVSYAKYYMSQLSDKKDICYLTGEEQVISDNHPKGVVAATYGAKLISANDDQGYTYRGRFQNASQPYALGYEASQKIHSALTWLVKNQGESSGTQAKRTFVCWNPQGKKTPDIFDPFGLYEEDEKITVPDIGAYRNRLWKSLQGYANQFEEEDEIIMIGLEAATTGRLSITYYNEYMSRDFYERLLNWGETCNWWFMKFDTQKKAYFKIQTPIFQRIVECAYGNQKGKFIEADDRVVKEQVQRLMKCVYDRQPLPFDIVQALVNKASAPLSYTPVNRELVLSTACAMVVKYYYDKTLIEKGESNLMKLDLENRDRSYLFGRLLAVYERAERVTYDTGESRETNAIRLQSAFVNHPMQTWKVLEDAVGPYFQKLRPASREFYKKLISEITTLFSEEDQEVMNQGLKENYLLGYYLQRAEFKKKEQSAKEQKEENKDGEITE